MTADHDPTEAQVHSAPSPADAPSSAPAADSAPSESTAEATRPSERIQIGSQRESAADEAPLAPKPVNPGPANPDRPVEQRPRRKETIVIEPHEKPSSDTITDYSE